MRRGVAWIDGCGFQVVLERGAGPLVADDAGEITTKQEKGEQQQKWRSQNRPKHRVKNRSQRQAGESGQQKNRYRAHDRHAENYAHGRHTADGEKSQSDRIEEIAGNQTRIAKLVLELLSLLRRQPKPTHNVFELFSGLRLRGAGNVGCLKSTEVKKDRDQDRYQRRCGEYIKCD